jgi:hypothetical protein
MRPAFAILKIVARDIDNSLPSSSAKETITLQSDIPDAVFVGGCLSAGLVASSMKSTKCYLRLAGQETRYDGIRPAFTILKIKARQKYNNLPN